MLFKAPFFKKKRAKSFFKACVFFLEKGVFFKASRRTWLALHKSARFARIKYANLFQSGARLRLDKDEMAGNYLRAFGSQFKASFF